MGRVELVTIGLRFLGLLLLLKACATLIRQVVAFFETLRWLRWDLSYFSGNLQSARENFGFDLGSAFIGVAQIALAIYLLWKGRWLVALLTRMDTRHCSKCGYDLGGVEGRGKCPECGTPKLPE